ncbi:MAG: PAS domain-containing sensor histidine kinase, partial [Betaproteobacteria bacterium]
LDQPLGSTSGTSAARNALRTSIPLALLPLQMEALQLDATAFRSPSTLTADPLLWITLALGVAVAIALAALVRFTSRLVRKDRALLTETALRRAMEDSLATGLRVCDRQGRSRYVNRS